MRLSFAENGLDDSASEIGTNGADKEVSVDGKISGSASSLLGLLMNRGATRPLVHPDVQISGDSEFIQEIHQLFSAMEIDCQEPLSKLIGDIPTHSLSQLLEKLSAFTKDSARAIKANIDEYLHEESRMMPPLNQVEMFDQDLGSLKLKLDTSS